MYNRLKIIVKKVFLGIEAFNKKEDDFFAFYQDLLG